MVIVVVTMCFIYRLPIPNENFNSWMMSFVFESQLDTNFSLTAYMNKMFLILDGNHMIFTWRNYIDRVYTKIFECHVFVNFIILAPEPDDIPSLLTAMHDTNK